MTTRPRPLALALLCCLPATSLAAELPRLAVFAPIARPGGERGAVVGLGLIY